ncbi:MAG: hypothetical protein JO279_15110 [Verrucomicrobia bacterium]|nr:hypothetical protein [Verrucomicrobiota bacterium]
MTISEKIHSLVAANQTFTIHLSDGRPPLDVRGRDWISMHPSGKGTSVTVYGPGDEEEHWIPLFAITSVSINELV